MKGISVGFRFQRRITILPGITLNMGMRGTSISMGARGARTTFSSRGIKQSFGIPGTGIRYETPYKKWSLLGRQNQPDQYNTQPVQYIPPQVSLWHRIVAALGF